MNQSSQPNAGRPAADRPHVAERTDVPGLPPTGGGPPPLPDATDRANADPFSRALQVVREGLRSMQSLQQQTATAHQRFLEGQEKAHQTLQTLMENHQRLVERSLGLPVSAPATSPALIDSAPTAGAPPESAPIALVAAPAAAPLETPPPIPIANAAAPLARQDGRSPGEPGGNGETQHLESALLDVVRETTGYPLDATHLDLELETDLGIDRVRRVEILSLLRARIADVPPLSAGQADRFSTLRQMVEFAKNDSNSENRPAVETSAPTESSLDVPSFEKVLLEVVSELTGYPIEMLDLDMDMEADLGIDSIKRLEIVSAVDRRIPGLESIDSQYMGSLRTLRNIIDYMAKPDAGRSAEPVAASPSGTTADRSLQPSENLQRRVLTVVDLPEASAGRLRVAPGHEVWVTDDGSDLAAALVDTLESKGFSARVIDAGAKENAREVPVGGLIHLAPPSESKNPLLSEASGRLLKTAFELTQTVGDELRHAADEGGALFVTISRLDGRFGLSGSSFDPAMGGLAGLTKTVAREWPGVHCRALDVARDLDDAKAVAAAIVDEIAADGPLEVALGAAGRRGLELIEKPAEPTGAALEPGEVVVITGGARGVTAEVAAALAKVERPVLVLLGRSPEPTPEPEWVAGLEDESAIKRTLLENAFNGNSPSPAELEREFRQLAGNREIVRNLKRVEAAGARVLYRSVDVRDADAVARVLEEIRRSEGPIRGLIHGAGVIEDRCIADKTRDAFERVFDTKVRGLAALLAATEEDDLRFIALFSSVSGRFGRQGQVDYAMANEVLNKTAQRLAAIRPSCRVVAINWGPWDGGMVSPALKREFARRGVGLIPLEAGGRALVDELREADRGAIEVVIGSSLPDATLPPRPCRAVPASHGSGELAPAFERRLDVARHSFLSSHVIAGNPVLPIAMMFEWLGHGALHHNPGLLLHGFEDFRVLKSVTLDNGPRDIRVVASKAVRRDDLYELNVELHSGTGPNECIHARARAVLADRLPAAPAFDARLKLDARPFPREVAEVYGDVLFHGPEFHAITRIRGHCERGMVAEVRPAPPPGDWMEDPPRSEWLGDPGILDAGLQLGLLWCHEHLGADALPSGAARYHQYQVRFPKKGITAFLTVREADAHRLLGDVDFVDANSAVIARLERVEWIADDSLSEAFHWDAAAGARL